MPAANVKHAPATALARVAVERLSDRSEVFNVHVLEDGKTVATIFAESMNAAYDIADAINNRAVGVNGVA